MSKNINNTQQPRDEHGRFMRKNAGIEDIPQTTTNNASEPSVVQEENTVHVESDEKKTKSKWNFLAIIIILMLAGHIVWCIMHHMDGQVQYCTSCDKPETACICAQMRANLLSQISELEAKLEVAEQSGYKFCGICGEQDSSCDCKSKYDEAIARDEFVNKLLNSGECSGLCPEHCLEHQATVTPTAKPTATPTAKPTATPTAKPTATPTAKPTATPTAKPTATPTVKPTVAPTTCPHTSTKKVEGTVTDLGNGEWQQECYKVCKACGDIVDTFYRGSVNVDAAIPTVTNSVEIEDDGEAGKPIS